MIPAGRIADLYLMDSTAVLAAASVLVAWIVLTVFAAERQARVREQELRQQAAAPPKPALEAPKSAPPAAKKAA